MHVCVSFIGLYHLFYLFVEVVLGVLEAALRELGGGVGLLVEDINNDNNNNNNNNIN